MTVAPQPPCEFGPFRLDPAEHRLLRDGVQVALTPKIFGVLCVLVRNHGRLVTKDQLLEEIWPDTFVDEGNLNRSISVLRRTLGELPGDQRYIETVPKIGYRFVAPVMVIPAVEQIAPRRANLVSRWRIAAIAAVSASLWLATVWTNRASMDPVRGSDPSHRQVTFGGHEGLPAMSPDGRWLAYVSSSSTAPLRQRVMIRRVDETEPVEVFSAAGAGFLRWSPTRRELLFWARTEAWEGIHTFDAADRRLRRAARGFYVATWSPDGNTLAAANFLKRRIHFLDREGQLLRDIPIEGDHVWVWDLDWSSADDWLLVTTSDGEGRYGIWTMRADGRFQRALHTDHAEIATARWGAHRRSIYFSRRASQAVSLLKLAVAAGDPRAAAPPQAILSGLEMDRSFGITSDGRHLTYARAPYHSNLWVVEPSDQGGAVRTRQLTTGTSLKERPNVSPDGGRVAFTMGRESQANLFVVEMNGGQPRALTNTNALSIGGVWSQDGASIAFASSKDGVSQLWRVPASGGAPSAIPGSGISDGFELSWHPGAHLLYQRAGNRDFLEVDQQTGTNRPLAQDSAVGWMFAPAQSPDGRIAVSWNRRDGRGLWIIDRASGRERLLRAAASHDLMPIGWSKDGRAVLAVEGKGAQYRGTLSPRGGTLTNVRILEITVTTGAARVVVELPFAEIGGVSMTPDGRRFVCTVYSSESDVWLVALG